VSKYAEWVEKVQHKPDPNVDVRVEPKFTIPDGEPYTGGWCRPQTDGPGIDLTKLHFDLKLFEKNYTGISDIFPSQNR
jgi:hypothetical protein